LVDALFAQDALVRSFERAHIYLWLDERDLYDCISEVGPCVRIGERGS